MDIVPSRIKSAMERMGYSRTELIDRCVRRGVKLTKSDLSQYLSGKYSPRGEKLAALCDVLECSPYYLYGLEAFDDFDDVEIELITCWRVATEDERMAIACLLKKYGMNYEV